MKAKRLLAVFLALALLLPGSPVGKARVAKAAGITLYASQAGTGDCSSWEKTCPLQTALSSAKVDDQIWVEQGLYTPGTNRTDTFQLKSGVKVYGGFQGGE